MVNKADCRRARLVPYLINVLSTVQGIVCRFRNPQYWGVMDSLHALWHELVKRNNSVSRVDFLLVEVYQSQVSYLCYMDSSMCSVVWNHCALAHSQLVDTACQYSQESCVLRSNSVCLVFLWRLGFCGWRMGLKPWGAGCCEHTWDHALWQRQRVHVLAGTGIWCIASQYNEWNLETGTPIRTRFETLFVETFHKWDWRS